MGQQASAPVSSPGGGGGQQKPTKQRKSTFSKLKSAALSSAASAAGTSSSSSSDEELRLARVRRKSFPYSQPEFDHRRGVLLPARPTRTPSPTLFGGSSFVGGGDRQDSRAGSSAGGMLSLRDTLTPQLTAALPSPSNRRIGTVVGGAGAGASPVVLLHVINWERLPDTAASTKTGSSNVWTSDFMAEADPQLLDAIAAQFARLQPKTAAVLQLADNTSKRLSVLDTRRTIKISLAMKRMGLEVKKFPKLIWALKDCNESYLTSDAVEILFEAQVWATPQEQEDIKTKIRLDGGEELLAAEDLLLWYLCKSVPDCGDRVRALMFRYEFESQLNVTLQSMAILKSACAEVCASQLLKRLLRTVLLVGNSINSDTSPAGGIALASLMRLNDFKAVNKPGVSFLDCVVSYLDVCGPEVFEVSDELMLVEKAACDIAPVSTQTEALRELKRELVSKVKPIRGLAGFLAAAGERLVAAEKDLVATKQTFDRCLEHFCLKSVDNVEFFGSLFEFIEDFNDGIGRLQTQQEQERRRLAELAAKQKRATAYNNRNAAAAVPVVRSGLQNAQYMSLRRASVAQHHSTPSIQQPVLPQQQMPRMSVFGRVKSVNFKDKLGPLSIGMAGSGGAFAAIAEEGGSPRSPMRPMSGRHRPVSLMISMQDVAANAAAAATEGEEEDTAAGGTIKEEDEEEEDEDGREEL